MENKKLLKEMFSLQQKLNDATNGKGWENGYNKHNRIINWRRCIYMECAELIDSFNWKHWKDINIAPDWDNIKIELVDIWHFVMSLGLEQYKNKNLGNIDDLVDYIVDTKYFDEFCKEPINPSDDDYLSIINSIEHMMKDALLKEDFYKITDDFLASCIECGLGIDELYKYYIGKNILNGFRQDNGYKEGTYKKVWNGKEDNEVMMSILESDSTLTANGLYKKLKEHYSKVA
jgi:dimeric dUTPase (all-alpha-NTP-PPase superfamily)